ncbi:MAG: AAA family ATPase [Clostridiales bacterium]|jgi:stage III sporulation protein AA|nr:AAA family ATPase [Clostridiales bacterium]
MEKGKDFNEEAALAYLPSRLTEAARKSAALYHGMISEIRLRAGCPMFLSVGGKNISCGVSPTADELSMIIRSLCGNSLYCHSETIKEGYICTEGGIRVGVCGRAVTEGGKILSVTDISSVAIRIPHRVPGVADGICRLILEEGFRGAILYSPPGVGKTTALREIAARLGAKPYNIRIAIIDTRFEICGSLGGDVTYDALAGYPRAKGMETAVRTLSPQLILCDEIGSEEDAQAIYTSFGAGVPTVVTAHAGSLEELCVRPFMRALIDSGAFTYAVGLSRTQSGFTLDINRISTGETAIC